MPAAITASSGQGAYGAAVDGDESKVLDLWASSLYRDLHRRPARDWDVSGACAPPPLDTELTYIQDRHLTRGGHLTLGALSYAAGTYELSIASDARIIHVKRRLVALRG
jgi:hypothetical protein